jgi:hypothetical protein
LEMDQAGLKHQSSWAHPPKWKGFQAWATGLAQLCFNDTDIVKLVCSMRGIALCIPTKLITESFCCCYLRKLSLLPSTSTIRAILDETAVLLFMCRSKVGEEGQFSFHEDLTTFFVILQWSTKKEFISIRSNVKVSFVFTSVFSLSTEVYRAQLWLEWLWSG